jgi:hypothetical protein
MITSEGGPRGSSYSEAMVHRNNGGGSRRPTFESPPDLRSQLLSEGTFKDKEMDIDSRKTPTTTSVTHPWIPKKCIPQTPQAPKYIIITPGIEEQKQYMREYTLVGKFLGLWPSEREMVKWIHQWWKPKGHFYLQLGSKGFFTIILHNLEDINCIFDGGSYFFNSTSLFLIFWNGKFIPETEDFAHAPLWIRLYSLP